MSKIMEHIIKNQKAESLEKVKQDDYSEEDWYYMDWLSERMSLSEINEQEWLERIKYTKDI